MEEPVPLPAEANVKIRFRLTSDNNDAVGDGWFIEDVWIGEQGDFPSGIENGDWFPGFSVSVLDQNVPNPFNPATVITYSIAERGQVTLRIFNTAGQLVRTLVDEEQAPKAGGFSMVWNGQNDQGASVASGVYFYQLTAKNFSETKKMVLLK